MNKIFILFALVGIFVLLGVSGVVAIDQTVEGDLAEVIACAVAPSVLDFGEIPFGPDIEDIGEIVTVDTAGSETESGFVDLEIEITADTDDEPGFYKTLLWFDLSNDGSDWTSLMTPIIGSIAEGDAVDFPTKLDGNSSQFNPGSKTATITYTCTGASFPV